MDQMNAILNVWNAGDRTVLYIEHSALIMKACKELVDAFEGNEVNAYRSLITMMRLEKDMTDFPALAPYLYKAALSCLEDTRAEGSTTKFDHDAVMLKLYVIGIRFLSLMILLEIPRVSHLLQ
ncbi:unnamed protein product [Ambrosiozyma monospora]|uniref:Unnamed protein product n=1 Tax=Ambrosiozyma monospora TaxID=43982 RepID=A0ACB5SSY9_AMBMO|nr:unnamed protein product [Ambrosiozyma monospora]